MKGSADTTAADWEDGDEESDSEADAEAAVAEELVTAAKGSAGAGRALEGARAACLEEGLLLVVDSSDLERSLMYSLPMADRSREVSLLWVRRTTGGDFVRFSCSRLALVAGLYIDRNVLFIESLLSTLSNRLSFSFSFSFSLLTFF